MPTAVRALKLVLRLAGVMMLVAVVFVFAPRSWMDAGHRTMGLGPLPEGPVVAYLARAVSALCAMMGGLFWVISYRTRRHASVIVYVGLIFALAGAFYLTLGWRLDIPWWWVASDGGACLVIGVLVLVLELLARRR